MVRSSRVYKQEMLSPTNHETGRCAHWCVLVVLLAVGALTISVATRYGAPEELGISATHTVDRHSRPTPGHQRLDMNAATWMPPVIDSMVLESPVYYVLTPSGPPTLKLFPESSLYNRPPPSA